jgi:hypothetical protein
MGLGLQRGRRWALVTLASVALAGSIGCQSMQDGAKQVSLGARDLGRRVSAPFRRSGPTSPDFGGRAAEQQDPFLPPPKRPDDDVSSSTPRPLNLVTLGEPTSLPGPQMRLASKPALSPSP